MERNFVCIFLQKFSQLLRFQPEFIRKDGYPSESHEIETEDGYLLTVHRIPGKEGSTPVFLQHGLLESSADWILPGKNRSLGKFMFITF